MSNSDASGQSAASSPAPASDPQGEPVSPPLQSRSFIGFLTTQALGAFNDNVFKQLVLLLSVGAFAVVEFQTIVQFVFAVPFLVFSGLAGELADRYSKGWLMVLCKVAEIGVMSAGVIAFLVLASGKGGQGPPAGLWMLAGVTFLMGCQSAFFGPPKYGGLPELVRESDLGQAVGLTQMTTFLAIILGTMTAGLLRDTLGQNLWIAGLIMVAIAACGTWTSLRISRVPAKDPARPINRRSFLSVFPTLKRIMATDRLLFEIMLVYSFFWLVGGVALPAINAYGRLQLGLTNTMTSLLVATLSLGIAIGSAVVARLSQEKVRIGLIVPGIVGMVICLAVVPLVDAHDPTPKEIKKFEALNKTGDEDAFFDPAPTPVQVTVATILIGLGVSAGLMSVPLLAFVQARPEAAAKGQVFALTNWLNWLFIVGSAGVYGLGMDLSNFCANRLLGGMSVLTAIVGFVLVPRILRMVREQQPEFVWRP